MNLSDHLPPADLLTGLPGEDLIRQGLADFTANQQTIPACLVEMSMPRLRLAGLVDNQTPGWSSDSELKLYRLLRHVPGDAYSSYNALVRQLISFEQALDHRCSRLKRTGAQ